MGREHRHHDLLCEPELVTNETLLVGLEATRRGNQSHQTKESNISEHRKNRCDTNARNLLLGIFVILTLVFASLTLSEYYQVNTLNSQLQSQSKSTVTRTLVSTTTVLTTDTCPADMICASFTSSPNSEVHVDSVEANKTGAAAHVAFWMTFVNTGDSPINFPSYSLNFSVPANSSVLRQAVCPQCFPGGTDVSSSITLNHDESYTLDAAFPNTKNFYYQAVQAGTVDVNLNFTWSADTGAICMLPPCAGPTIPSNTMTILAQFVFP
jgi:hypothetical protein